MEKKNDHIGILLRHRSDTLTHHGIKGQKWYKRRFQKEDGSLTELGRKRYGVGDEEKGKRDSENATGESQAAPKSNATPNDSGAEHKRKVATVRGESKAELNNTQTRNTYESTDQRRDWVDPKGGRIDKARGDGSKGSVTRDKTFKFGNAETEERRELDAEARALRLATQHRSNAMSEIRKKNEAGSDAVDTTPGKPFAFGKKKTDSTETETPKPEAPKPDPKFDVDTDPDSNRYRNTWRTDDNGNPIMDSTSSTGKGGRSMARVQAESMARELLTAGNPTRFDESPAKPFAFGKKKSETTETEPPKPEAPAAPKRDDTPELVTPKPEAPAAPKRDTSSDDVSVTPRPKTFSFGKNKDGDEDDDNPYRDRFGKTNQDDDYRSGNKPVTFGKKSDDDDSDSTPKTFSFGKNKDGDEDDDNPYRDRFGKIKQDDDYSSGSKPFTFGKGGADKPETNADTPKGNGKGKDAPDGPKSQPDTPEASKGKGDSSEGPTTKPKGKGGTPEPEAGTPAPKGKGKGGAEEPKTDPKPEPAPKKEFDFDKASKVANAGANLANTLKKQSDERIKNAPKVKLDLSNMTNAELRAAIDRGALEKAYHDYYAPSSVSKGEVTFNKMLGTISAVLAIGGSALSLAGAIKGFLK